MDKIFYIISQASLEPFLILTCPLSLFSAQLLTLLLIGRCVIVHKLNLVDKKTA